MKQNDSVVTSGEVSEVGSGEKYLNIAMLGHKRIPSREGGVEIVVEELSTRMAARGHRITCYNRGGHHVSGKEYDQSKKREYHGVRLKYVPTIDRKGLAAATASFCASFCCAFGRYDVVHYHAEGPCVMLWLPKLMGKRCIATIHGLDWQRAKWGGFAGKYIKFGEKIAVKYADEIIVLSRSAQKYFKQTYGRKTRYIPNGTVRPQNLEPERIREQFGLEKDSYILFLGRIVPEKGIQYLIEAFRKTDTEKKLVIAGGSSDTDVFLEKMRNLADGDERIIFTGFVQGKTLEELYSNAYVYVLPSDLEGMPLSLLEAMSYGNCCLVSDIPECTEVVGESAVVFRKGDTEELRKALQGLINDPGTVETYKAGAAEYILGRYDWEKVTEETLRIYRAQGEMGTELWLDTETGKSGLTM